MVSGPSEKDRATRLSTELFLRIELVVYVALGILLSVTALLQRLEAVLEAFALISHERHATELAAFLHRGEHVARAHQQLRDLIRDLLIEGAATGHLRDDVAPDELASYCLHALTAASNLRSKAAVRRLVAVTLAGLRPARAS
jgi:hypothetical protein